MQLCDKDIHKAISDGDIGFVGTNEKFPFQPEHQIQPSSIDLRLGDIIVRFKSSVKEFDIKDTIDKNKHLDIKKYDCGMPITILPGEIVYAQIYEQMWIGDKYSARVEGRSRVARLGLTVHCTGSYINPGFCGAMPLQIINNNKFPITIYPYTEICQLVLFEISGEPLIKYSDRSRIFNPYFDEAIASPSVLKPVNTYDINKQSIVEQRMTKLVKDYYNGLEENKRNSLKKTPKYDEIIIGNVVTQNILQGDFKQMRDNYSAKQAGTQGPGSGTQATINQSYFDSSNIDFQKLVSELDIIKGYLKKSNEDDEDNDILIGEVSKAAKAAKDRKKDELLSVLKSSGSRLYDIAKTIGCTLVSKIILEHIGL